MSRGRKVERHSRNVIRTCSKGEMESSCASALPVREPENIEAARKREINASDPLAAPEVAGKWETNAPCLRGQPKAWDHGKPACRRRDLPP